MSGDVLDAEGLIEVVLNDIAVAIIKLQGPEIFAHAGVGIAKREAGIVHPENVLIKEAAGADRPDLLRVLALENGNETRDVALHIIFVDDIRPRQPGLIGAGIPGIVGDLDRHGAPLQDGRVWDDQPGEGVDIGGE